MRDKIIVCMFFKGLTSQLAHTHMCERGTVRFQPPDVELAPERFILPPMASPSESFVAVQEKCVEQDS